MAEYFLLRLRLNEPYRNPEAWTEHENNLIMQHFGFLMDLSKRGILVFAGRTEYDFSHEDLFGIALIKAESLEEAKNILFQDPAVKAQLQIADVHPYRMAIEAFENSIMNPFTL